MRGLPKLDRDDFTILAALQSNGRMTHQDIGELVGLSASPCLQRVKRLKQAGVATCQELPNLPAIGCPILWLCEALQALAWRGHGLGQSMAGTWVKRVLAPTGHPTIGPVAPRTLTFRVELLESMPHATRSSRSMTERKAATQMSSTASSVVGRGKVGSNQLKEASGHLCRSVQARATLGKANDP